MWCSIEYGLDDGNVGAVAATSPLWFNSGASASFVTGTEVITHLKMYIVLQLAVYLFLTFLLCTWNHYGVSIQKV